MRDFLPKLLGVGVGGALGTLLRFAIINLFSFLSGFRDWKLWAIVVVNFVGSLLIGLVANSYWLRGFLSRFGLTLDFLTIGLLGGFTTFSSFAAVLAEMAHDGRVFAAFFYGFASTFVSVAILLLVLKNRL